MSLANLKILGDLAKDSLVEDDFNEDILNVDWLKHYWPKTAPFPNKQTHLNQLIKVMDKVKDKQANELYEKLKRIFSSYDNDKISFNNAKSLFLEAFKENVEEKSSSELSDPEKQDLMNYATQAYENYSNDKVKYSKLPPQWLKILNPLLKTGRSNSFKKEVDKLSHNESEDKSVKGLEKKFDSIFKFSPKSKEDIIKFCEEHNLEDEADDVYECIYQTFKAYEDSSMTNPTYEKAVVYFKNLFKFPQSYRTGCSKWFDIRSASEKSAKSKQYRVGSKQAKSVSAELSSNKSTAEMIEAIKRDKEYYKHYSQELIAHKELLQKGKIDKDTAKRQMLEVIKYCYKNVVHKSKSAFEIVKDEIKKMLSPDEQEWFIYVVKSLDKTDANTKKLTALKDLLSSTEFENNLNGKRLEDLGEEAVTEFFKEYLLPTSRKAETAVSNLYAKAK